MHQPNKMKQILLEEMKHINSQEREIIGGITLLLLVIVTVILAFL